MISGGRGFNFYFIQVFVQLPKGRKDEEMKEAGTQRHRLAKANTNAGAE